MDKDVMKSKSVQPVNILHYDGGRDAKSLSKPFFLNCIYFKPKSKSPAGRTYGVINMYTLIQEIIN